MLHQTKKMTHKIEIESLEIKISQLKKDVERLESDRNLERKWRKESDERADKLEQENTALKTQNKEWEKSFDLYHNAIMHGTEIFRQNNPDYPELSYPDTGKMVANLCEMIDDLRKEVQYLKEV